MEKARGEPRSRKKVDIERSGDRIDSRISIYNSLRGVIFCYGNGEMKKKYIYDSSYYGHKHKTYTFTLPEQETKVLLEFLHGWEGIWGRKSNEQYRKDYSALGNLITTQKKTQDETKEQL